MSSVEAFDAKERVRERTDIVELVGESLPLRRQGQNFVAACPWHHDNRPSLQINPSRQSWKCWVCDIGGDVYSYVMKRENIEFREALQLLADRAGIELTQNKARRTQPGSPNDKSTLLRAAAWAVDQYHQFLLESPEAEVARVYLKDRDINSESIERYRIGFSPGSWQWIIDRAQSTEHSLAVLEAIGLVLRSQKTGRPYERFRGRVLFPISDSQKRPIGLGGRILPALQTEGAAKYINSPETLLYSKSDQLYGLDLARDTAPVKSEREIVVMEGYTDVVMSRQFGLENVVAVLGTSLTERHVRLLRRFADRITLVLDGDEAGKRKANSILELFVASQIDLRIVTLPAALDPCDYMLQNGLDAFRALIKNAPDALEHKVAVVTENLDPLRDTHQANVVLEGLLSTIAKGPRLKDGGSTANHLREQQILNRLAREFQIEELTLRTMLQDVRKSARTKPIAHSSEESTSRIKPELAFFEQDLFELLIRHPESIPAVLENISIDALQSPLARELHQKYCDLEAEGVLADFERLTLEFDDPEIKNLLVEMDERSLRKNDVDGEIVLQELLESFSRRQAEIELRSHQTSLESQELNDEEQMNLLQDLIRKRQEMT